jgi:putative oxidoreductase
MNAAYTLGRILIPLLFLVEGIRKLINVDRIAKMLADNNVPIPDQIAPYLTVMGLSKYQTLGYLVAAIEIICGLMIMAGLAARWGALILVVFTAATIFFVHHFWDMPGDAFYANMTEALKNLSILGGLLLVVAVGSGPTAIHRD